MPDYLSSSDIEAELLAYGSVAHIKRDYHEFDGYRLDSEVRHIFFTSLDRELPQSISIDGNDIFVTLKSPTPVKVRAEKDNRLKSGISQKTTRSREAAPVVPPPREESLHYLEEKPQTSVTSKTSITTTLPTTVRQRSASPHKLSLDVEKIANGPIEHPTKGHSPSSPETQGHAQKSYTEIINSPHGTLPRRIHERVCEVVESPVEEVTRNLSPYMERHQLKLQGIPGREERGDDKLERVGNRKHSTGSSSRKQSPAMARRRRAPPADESSSGPDHSG